LGDRNYQGGFDSRNAIAYPGKREEERKYVAARERSKRVAVGYYYDERGRRQTIYETYRWVEPAYYNVTVYEWQLNNRGVLYRKRIDNYKEPAL
jgi:elongation factor P hydroxylase